MVEVVSAWVPIVGLAVLAALMLWLAVATDR
jgi:hypothetical protein